MEKDNHYVLGFSRRRSGAFEHAFGLARNLNERGHDTKYFSHWWDSPAFDVDLDTESETKLNLNQILDTKGVFHLQTHTWEHNGLLDMVDWENSTLIYGLHAVIPYYHMGEEEKKALLSGDLPQDKIKKFMEERPSEREKAQLRSIDKADHLLTISKNLKKILGALGIEKPSHVFENVSDVYDLPEEAIEEGYAHANDLRERFDEENILIYSGRLYPKKGSSGLLNSFRMIRESEPSSRLILLGSGENDMESLEKYGLHEEDKDKLTLVPWINKSTREGVREYLGHILSSDVLIQPMITPELYSKSVIDAMSLGIPTITCESPYSIGSSENAEEIYDSFREFKESPGKVKEIVESARQKVERENTWDSYVSRLENIVEEEKAVA